MAIQSNSHFYPIASLIEQRSVTAPAFRLPMAPYIDQYRPWVTVICTCFNHQYFVESALQSVISQTYPNVELIVVNNASTDASAERIHKFIEHNPSVQFIDNEANIGLCRAFNDALTQAHGHYIIDLAADDILLPDRIARQVEAFERLPDDYGVVFSNAGFIDANGQLTGYHFPLNEQRQSKIAVPSGAIFRQILTHYFICTPTMMMRRDMLDALGGYDETLSFEDFDFWVRSARHYKYAYLDAVLTHKRLLPGSLSMQVIRPDNQLLSDTLRICYKAFDLCNSPDEYTALAQRVRQFIRKAFYAEQHELVMGFGKLLRYLERPDPGITLILLLSRLHLPVNGLYICYLKYRNYQPWAVLKTTS